MPEEKDKLRTLYDAVSKDYDIGTYEDFSAKINNPEKRKTFYEGIGEEYQLGTYDQFEDKLGFKKKVSSKPFSFGSETLPEAVAKISKSVFSLAPENSEYSQGKTNNIPAPKVSPKVAEFNAKYNTTLTDAQIQGKEPISEDISTGEAAGRNFIGGVNDLFAATLKVPNYLQRIVATPIMEIAGMSDEEKQKFFQEQENNPLSPSYALDQIANYYKSDANKMTAPVRKQFNESVTKLIDEGKYTDAAKKVGVDLAASLPATLGIVGATAAGVPSAAITPVGATVFGSQNYQDIHPNSQMSEGQRQLNTFGKGLMEGVFEQLGTGQITKSMINAIKDVSKEEGKQLLKNQYLTAAKEALKPYFPITAPIQEGLTEAATQLSQNVIDQLTDPDKKDINIMDGVADAGIVGGVMGTAFGAAPSIPLTIKSIANKVKGNEIQSQLNNIDSELDNDNVSEPAKQVLLAEREKVVSQGNDLIEQDQEVIQKLPAEQQQQLTELSNQFDQVEDALGDPNISEETRALLETRKSDLEKQQNELLNTKQDATKEINKQESIQSERENRNESGQTTETSGSNSLLSETPSEEEGISKLKEQLVKGNKVVLDTKGKVEDIRQNSGASSHLFKDLTEIIGDKEKAADYYFSLKNDQGRFKNDFADWENKIMRDYGRSGNEYTIQRPNKDEIEGHENDYAWSSEKNGKPVIFFNDNLLGRDIPFAQQKQGFIERYINPEIEEYRKQGNEAALHKMEEYKKLFEENINSNRDIKLHLIHNEMHGIMNVGKEITPDDIENNYIRSVKEVMRLDNVKLAKDYYGEPMIYATSAPEGINKFRKPGSEGYKRNDPFTGEEGIYFSRDIRNQEKYAGFNKGTPATGKDIYYTFLKVKKPYYMDDPQAQAQYPINDIKTITTEQRKALEDLGYDAIIKSSVDRPKEEVVVFDPDQIEIIGSYRKGLIKNPNEIGKPKENKITAYHGTPFTFDKFSMEKIGDGEGAQAFGYGLYFTDTEEVAKWYADTLKRNIKEEKIKLLNQLYTKGKITNTQRIKNMPISGRINDWFTKTFSNLYLSEAFPGEKISNQDIKNELNKLEDKVKGKSIYKVNLSGSDWLEWGKPLNEEQKNKILKQASLENISISEWLDEHSEETVSDLYFFLLNKLGSAKEASLFLNRAGVNGIKYPTGDVISKPDIKKGFNYVVFDDNAVTIEEINNIKQAIKDGEITEKQVDNIVNGQSITEFESIIEVATNKEKDHIEKIIDNVLEESAVELSDEQKAKDNKEAEKLGWANSPAAINSIRKRTGEDYKTWEEIPDEIKEKVSNERKKEKEEKILPEGEQANIGSEDNIDQITERLDKVIQEEPNLNKRKKKKFILTVKNSPKTTEELNEEVKKLDEFYDAVSNKESIAKADKEIKKDISAVKDRVLSSEPVSAEKGALFIRLIKHYEHQQDYSQAADLVDAYDKQLREAGRFIQAASLWNKLAPETVIRVVKKEIPKLSKDAETKIYERLSEVDKMSEGIEKDKATLEVLNYIVDQDPWHIKAQSAFDAFRYQNMLSSPRSHLRNIYGNLFNVFLTRPVSLVAESTKDFISNWDNPAAREAKFSQISQYYKDVFTVIPDAFVGFREAMGDGNVTDKILDLGNAHSMIEAVRQSKLPKYLTVVARLMEGQDRFNSVMIGEGEKMRLMRNGVEESVATTKAQELANEFLYRDKFNPSDKDKATFVRALESLGLGIDYLRKTPVLGKPLSWLIPFLKTPVNVAKMSIKYSPLGFIGGNHNNQQVAASSIGSTLMGIGAIMALQGLTTWGLPEDKDERDKFYASGRKPYSIKIGDTWVPLAYFGPLGFALAMPAAVKHYQVDSKNALTDSQQVKLGKAIASMSEYFMSQLPLESLEGFIKLIKGDYQTDTGKELAKISSQVIPASGMVRYVDNALDPVYRKAHGFEETIKSGIPGLSNDLEYFETPKGEPAKREPVNLLMPYDIGFSDSEYEALLQNRRLTLQKEQIPKEAAKEYKPTPEASKLSREAKTQNNSEQEKNKSQRERIQGLIDKKLKTTEEEKQLREIVRVSSDPRSIIITELDKIPSNQRMQKFIRWKQIGVVSDEIFKDFKVTNKGDIKLR